MLIDIAVGVQEGSPAHGRCWGCLVFYPVILVGGLQVQSLDELSIAILASRCSKEGGSGQGK